jgi:hypothetical protein
MVEGDIRTFLLTQSTITSTSVLGQQIYVGQSPATVPTTAYAIITRVSDTRWHDADITTMRIQVTVFDTLYNIATGHSDLVRDVLSRYIGTMTSTRIVSCVFDGAVTLKDTTLNKWYTASDYILTLRKR